MGVLNIEAVLLTCVRAAATLLLEIFGEGVEILCRTVPAGGPTPPVRPVTTHVIPFEIYYERLTEGEIEVVVRCNPTSES